MHETTFIRKTLKPFLIKEHAALVVKYHGGPQSEVGVSDLLCCIRGFFCAFEVKMEGGKVTEVQNLFLRRVREAGGKAGVVYSHSFERDIEQILL